MGWRPWSCKILVLAMVLVSETGALKNDRSVSILQPHKIPGQFRARSSQIMRRRWTVGPVLQRAPSWSSPWQLRLTATKSGRDEGRTPTYSTEQQATAAFFFLCFSNLFFPDPLLLLALSMNFLCRPDSLKSGCWFCPKWTWSYATEFLLDTHWITEAYHSIMSCPDCPVPVPDWTAETGSRTCQYCHLIWYTDFLTWEFDSEFTDLHALSW
jgi:hypothetical protein